MNERSVFVLLFFVTALISAAASQNATEEKTGKVFSLFSVVQFKNTGCKSQSSMTSGQSTVRNGTCFTSSECSSKGGTASGNCAAGFGVCCLFLISSTSSTINQNCTYLRNPSFPSVYTATSSLSYTVSKCSSDICYLRLDFETFTTVGPPNEATACPDTFKITTNTGMAIPTLCGRNTGQHIYVDIGMAATDTATLAFTFSTATSTIRTWEIKVSQISCSNPNRPPNGCLQYWTTLVGRFQTFNFMDTAGVHPQSLSYSACVRRALGYCCVEYITCNGVSNAFTLDGQANSNTKGFVDSKCSVDYIAIPGSSATSCAVAGNNALQNRYCGGYLGYQSSAKLSYNTVCDCTPPFDIYVTTDAAAEAIAVSRGVCLDFMQVPCN